MAKTPLIEQEPLVRGTPWEVHTAAHGRPVHVKREDLSSPRPGPPFSKMRGVLSHILKRPEPIIGVLDTIHSRGGWAVARACQLLDRHAVVYYPQSRALPGPFESQREAEALGAGIIPLEAGRSAVLYHRAKKDLLFQCDRPGEAYMMPNALKLSESVEETAKEVVHWTPPELVCGSWVISASSGTIAAGVLAGLAQTLREARGAPPARVVLHLGYSRPEKAFRTYVNRMVEGQPYGLRAPGYLVVDEGYSYRDRVDDPVEFPCSPYYDLKTWRWIGQQSAEALPDPVVFWNVGVLVLALVSMFSTLSFGCFS